MQNIKGIQMWNMMLSIAQKLKMILVELIINFKRDFQFAHPYNKYFFIVKKVEKRSNNMRTISGFEVIYGLCLTPLR